MSFRSGGSGGPMTLSQVPGSPSFRSSAVNAVAVIPLLSSDRSGQDDPNTASSKSFNELLDALNRYNMQATGVGQPGDELLLVVPNSSLTRPGDWKYDNTPLKNFHWGHGCQRLSFFDGRPYNSRMAHDRLINHELTRNWIDLCPSRRTAALIGVLNVKDCPDMATLKRAEQEWRQWAERYSTPPYEVSAHGRDFERDFVVQRLFVFDSFHESNKVDVSKTSLGSSLVAFPPSDDEHTQMMDLHMNVVINDLAVAVFQELEGRIRESDAITKGTDGQPLSSAAAKSRFSSLLGTASTDTSKEEKPQGSSNLSINSLASVVSPDSSLASPTGSKDPRQLTRTEPTRTRLSVSTKGSSSEAQLLTPLDDVWDFAELSPKDAHEMMKREVGRREKYAGDLALLAGSPLDAYERYMKAADLCKTSCPDPLWYASALEGCAAAHVAMAEAGGFNIEEYLESSFQLPDEMMASAILPSGERANKQNMSSILSALCDDALNITSRHPKLACFRAELLLKLAWYSAEVEDVQQRCLWGMGEGCYGGEAGSDKKRWEMPSATQLNFLDLKNKKGEDIVKRNTIQRCQKWSEVMHKAVGTGALDPVTRADVALRCASLCLKGLRPTNKPTSRERSESRLQFRRKAAFFAVAAAESLSELDEVTNDRTSAMWVQASRLLSQNSNTLEVGNYGWATLRAVALHGLAIQGLREASEVAAVELLSLMSEISPKKPNNSEPAAFFSKAEEEYDDGIDDRSIRSDGERSFGPTTAESVVSAARAARSAVKDARTYVQEVRTKRPSFFSGLNVSSTALLAVAQSKWVEDDEISPILLPMSDLSEISNLIIAMRSVWSGIKFQNCVDAQKKVIEQISDLRESMPASTMPSQATESKSSFLPIKITGISITDTTEGRSSLERVKTKSESKAENKGAMATFFNPYADKRGDAEAILLPEGEERYISVKFANRLAVPLEIPRCQLEFTVEHNDQIKAPAISFVIPGETDDFSVQFPFMVLSAIGAATGSEDPVIYEVKGLHVTCLGRGFFLPVGSDGKANQDGSEDLNIPFPASQYPRRKYNQNRIRSGVDVKSPRLEIVPAQPNLLLSFAAASTPMEDGTVIPAPIADGEVYDLPKLVLSNESGFDGMGMIKELQIIALGLQGHPKLVLFDLNEDVSKGKMQEETKKEEKDAPMTLTAKCDNVDFDRLNQKPDGSRVSSISFQLSAAANMGTLFKGGSVTIRFRYRGEAPSPNLQVWRKREVLIGIVRTKGPRISSLTFRPDLSWESAYSSLCKSIAHEEKHKRFHHSKSNGKDNSSLGTADDEDFVSHRLGKDPGVHVCGDKVVAMVTVANETSSTIVLSKSNESVGGFEGIPIETMRVAPGVSAKIPMILQRIDRTPELAGRLVEMTKLLWKSDTTASAGDGLATETGGTMVPLNMRVRKGCIQIPSECLKSIIDENKTLLSRICKAPVAVDVSIIGGDGNNSVTTLPVKQGVPVDTTVQVQVAEWVPDDLLKDLDFRLKFCCAPKDSSRIGLRRDFVWSGQIRKSLDSTEKMHNHRARLLFLNEGDYVISACVSLSRAHAEDDDIKEIWWAKRAQQVHVRATTLSQ